MEEKSAVRGMSQVVEEDMRVLAFLVMLVLVLSITNYAFAVKPDDKPPKDDHGGGPPDDKGKPDDVPKGPPDDKGKPDDVPKGPKAVSGAGGCVRMWITNDPKAYARCTIIDVSSPTIQQITTSKAGKTCVYVTDDLGVKMVLIGNKVLDRFNYTDWFCGFGPFDYNVVIVVDYATNVGVKTL